VSRNRSAAARRARYSGIGTRSAKTSRSAATPRAAASRRKLSGTAGLASSSHSVLPGTARNSRIHMSKTAGASAFFTDGLGRFTAVEGVSGQPTNNGLGPRFNTNQCSSCHAQPAVGGTSPSTSAFPNLGPNPETLVYNLAGQTGQNTLPSFVTPDGPVREARFKFFLNQNGSLSNTPDGGVHDLFVISGRGDAGACGIRQPDFAHNLALNNVIFRIPTPVFGAGLIENIADETIMANMEQNERAKEALGISGHPNRDGNEDARRSLLFWMT